MKNMFFPKPNKFLKPFGFNFGLFVWKISCRIKNDIFVGDNWNKKIVETPLWAPYIKKCDAAKSNLQFGFEQRIICNYHHFPRKPKQQKT